MRVRGKVCIVTGGASGIGAALCERFHAEGAAGVVVVDRNAEGATAVADSIGGHAVVCDLASQEAVEEMVASVGERYGPVDLLCNNAGIVHDEDFLSGNTDTWHDLWAVNVMAHVHAVRAVLPQMLERGVGAILHTASIAGLLTSPGLAAYTATKHAVVGLAEWLSVTYGHRGIKVFLLAPMGVDTPMLAAAPPTLRPVGPVRSASEVAQQVIEGLAREDFLIFTDPAAAGWVRGKADDIERWLTGMRRLQDEIDATGRGQRSSHPDP